MDAITVQAAAVLITSVLLEKIHYVLKIVPLWGFSPCKHCVMFVFRGFVMPNVHEVSVLSEAQHLSLLCKELSWFMRQGCRESLVGCKRRLSCDCVLSFRSCIPPLRFLFCQPCTCMALPKKIATFPSSAPPWYDSVGSAKLDIHVHVL